MAFTQTEGQGPAKTEQKKHPLRRCGWQLARMKKEMDYQEYAKNSWQVYFGWLHQLKMERLRPPPGRLPSGRPGLPTRQ